MPTYPYKCYACGAEDDVMRPIEDRDKPLPCAGCKTNMVRVPAAPGVVFKGPGFYETDYKAKRPPKGGAHG